jgi:hypothetical protein
MFSRQDDFPLDWDPITVICGKSTGFCTPTTAKASWSLFTVLMSSGSMMPLTPGSSKSAMVDQQFVGDKLVRDDFAEETGGLLRKSCRYSC